MSWIEWMGEQWETTQDTAELHVHLWQPESMCPRAAWSLSLRHAEYEVSGDKRKTQRCLRVDLSELHFRQRDWRHLAGLDIRADAAWQAAHEYHNELGSLIQAQVDVQCLLIGNTRYNPSPLGINQHWTGGDFLLHLGPRDGHAFSCELDAWLLPHDEYWCSQPETPDEFNRFAQGPPQLRLITRAIFTGGSVHVPRAADPLPLARRYLREEIALGEIHDPKVEWNIRRKLNGIETEEVPGASSTVHFKTQPLPEA